MLGFFRVILEAVEKTFIEIKPLIELQRILMELQDRIKDAQREKHIKEKRSQLTTEGKRKIKITAKNILNNIERVLHENKELLTPQDEEMIKKIIKKHSEWIDIKF